MCLALYFPRKGCRPPVFIISSFLSNMRRTGMRTLFLEKILLILIIINITNFLAATATAEYGISHRDSFPPKPPPTSVILIQGL